MDRPAMERDEGTKIPELMKAAVYQKAGEPMLIKSIHVPQTGPGEVLVKIAAASLCGSDLVAYRGYLGPETIGLAGGHEAVGKVVAKHPSVIAGFEIGDCVGLMNCVGNCNFCTPCLAGSSQYCESGKRNNGFTTNGFFAEYAVVKAQFAVKVSDRLPLERLSPLFCAGVTAFGALKRLDLPVRGTIGVFGLGGVGAFVVRFAIAMGYQVIGFDVSTAAMAAAKSYGAVATIDLTDATSIRHVLDPATRGRQLDSSIVTAGVQGAYSSAIEYTAFDGTIVAVGIPASAIDISILPFIKKRLRLQGTQSASPLELRQMMHMAEQFDIIPEIELGTLEDIPEMMEEQERGPSVKLGFKF